MRNSSAGPYPLRNSDIAATTPPRAPAFATMPVVRLLSHLHLMQPKPTAVVFACFAGHRLVSNAAARPTRWRSLRLTKSMQPGLPNKLVINRGYCT